MAQRSVELIYFLVDLISFLIKFGYIHIMCYPILFLITKIIVIRNIVLNLFKTTYNTIRLLIGKKFDIDISVTFLESYLHLISIHLYGKKENSFEYNLVEDFHLLIIDAIIEIIPKEQYPILINLINDKFSSFVCSRLSRDRKYRKCITHFFGPLIVQI